MFDHGRLPKLSDGRDVFRSTLFLVKVFLPFRWRRRVDVDDSRNVKTQSAVFPPTSVLPLLNLSPNCTIAYASVRPNGVPVIHCSTGVAHSYDPMLLTWVKVSERWWSEGSDAWQGRQRGSALSASRGVVISIEGFIGSNDDSSAAEKPRPSWWGTALTLGHLETRMHAARVLDSPSEYKQALLLYAKKISDEAFKGKAEELIKELFGPVYWSVELHGFLFLVLSDLFLQASWKRGYLVTHDSRDVET